MGYPMTFKRVLHRNRLDQGDYGTKLIPVNTSTDVAPRVPNDGSDFKGLHIRFLSDEIDKANQIWSTLCGDLRRLERDAVDEAAICAYVAKKIGIDPEIVAAVLKEFIAW